MFRYDQLNVNWPGDSIRLAKKLNVNNTININELTLKHKLVLLFNWSICTIYVSIFFVCVCLCSFTLFYSFAGAFLIGLIDHDIEGIRSVTERVEKERVSLSNQFWSNIIQYNIFKEEDFKQDAIEILKDYEKFLFDMIKQNRYDETFKSISENTLDEWPIPEGLFFAMTVITTIGK